MYERKYIKLMGKIAEARVLHDWERVCHYKYELELLKEEMA